jgi:hypothetical protein
VSTIRSTTPNFPEVSRPERLPGSLNGRVAAHDRTAARTAPSLAARPRYDESRQRTAGGGARGATHGMRAFGAIGGIGGIGARGAGRPLGDDEILSAPGKPGFGDAGPSVTGLAVAHGNP